MATLELGSQPCHCEAEAHPLKFIALTGGPGAGKTAVLEMARRSFCSHVAILPEAASIIFGGGFPRHDNAAARSAAQRAIFHVQKELEALVAEEGKVAIALCDRGTLDGLAYWPGPPESYWAQLNTTLEAELGRYSTVIHMRTPRPGQGYNQAYALRIESADEAAAIDHRIDEAWSQHPRRHIVNSSKRFLEKGLATLQLIQAELPECCRAHALELNGGMHILKEGHSSSPAPQ